MASKKSQEILEGAHCPPQQPQSGSQKAKVDQGSSSAESSRIASDELKDWFQVNLLIQENKSADKRVEQLIQGVNESIESLFFLHEKS